MANVPYGVGSAAEVIQLGFFALQAHTDNPALRTMALSVQDDGGWHKHLIFSLFPNEFEAGYTPGDPVADAGIYLLQLQLTPNFNDLPASDPLWIVLNYGMDETAHDAAISFAQNNLAGVPEPGSAMTLLVAGAVVVMMRRRH